MAQEMVQCTLPHSDPGDVEAFTRRDGNLVFGVRSGYDHKAQKRIGLPYGSISRLLLLWMTSEAVRTNNARLELGDVLNDFLRDVGLDPKTSWGKRGDVKRLKEQMLRLFTAETSFSHAEGTATQGGHRSRLQASRGSWQTWDSVRTRQPTNGNGSWATIAVRL